ncbi:MAG: MiaB/RimO family radical SAM methylthiotransferase, partial [Nitrospinaceae bacterium]|nr:MiaB/RimO family radical SAM methylthiotransferase [Nitrospinaceae bacterium]NIR54553.1 MiaB/RimO family radical SAM methylthiotransferase [Nitrospinaceae bacterium]NIS84972.1 MiaB/RimO family radical SAM methylthiotransferase [Nitrospinaceae bacterium]NIT81786.1 MiaB/RimO family radical SAM methylthiotransferase [Nitrospinaceae bacterium]NIU44055.1 MiaB/RimO family radical SAM methylthiotransferase [Nitrospinaceae bacterium]
HNSRQALKKSLAINDDAMVVFTGCYAQTHAGEAAQLQGLDVVLGNANKLEIAEVIRKQLARMQEKDAYGLPLVHMSDITQKWDFRTIPVSQFHGKTKAFIKVQTGCDETCSFCTVVRARGRSISDSRKNILLNIRRSIDAGFKEITLTGINLGTYGMDHNPPESFSSLVEEILGLEGDFRVRLSSINPMEIDDRLIALMAERENLCPHFHIPLQSGDDTILRRMRRNYNTRQYRQVVERAAGRIPRLGLGADIIVGFPGETGAMFENTRRLVEELPFTALHVFSYSPREGTDAARLNNDVPNKIKKERNKILTDLGARKALAFRRGLINQTVRVLAENSRDPGTGHLRGHSENYIPLVFEGEDRWMNRVVP